MVSPTRVDKKMLKQFDFVNNSSFDRESRKRPSHKFVIENKKRDMITTLKSNSSNTGNEKIEELDVFLTLIVKTLPPKERYLLLTKLMNLNWTDQDDTAERFLSDLISSKKTDDELRQTIVYEQFLFDFNNWKNYFCSKK